MLPDLAFEPSERLLQPSRVLLPRFGLGGPLLQASPKAVQDHGLCIESLGELVIFLEAEGDSQLLQAIAVLLVTLRLGRLQFDAAELLLDFLDDVAKALEVLIDALSACEAFPAFLP